MPEILSYLSLLIAISALFFCFYLLRKHKSATNLDKELRVGIDLVSIERIEKAYKKFGNKFISRLLTEREYKELEKFKANPKVFIHRLAGRFAAKEAVAKLLQTGIGKDLSFKEIEVIRGSKGDPNLFLYGKAQSLAKGLNIFQQKISITHDDDKAIAVAVAD